MKIFTRKDIDDKKWNALAERSNPSYIHFYTWYLDVICPNWKAIIVEKEGKYEVAFPLPWRKKWGVSYVYPPFLAQQLGVLAEKPIEVDPFLFALEKHFPFIEYYLHHKTIGSSAINFQNRKNLVLDLNLNYDNLKSRFSGNNKRNINKSERNPLKITTNTDFLPVIDLFQSNRGRDFTHLSNNDYQYFKNVCQKVSENGKIEVLHAYDDQGKLLAGAIFFLHHNRITFMFSGIIPEGKKRNAMFALLNYSIRTHAGENKIFDFEGSETKGVYEFYEGFGAKLQPYFFYKRNGLPFYLKWLKS